MTAPELELEEFYRAHCPRLRAQLRRQFPRHADAVDDALQHACLKALQAPEPVRDLLRYVARIATNHLIDGTRYDRRFAPDDGTLMDRVPSSAIDRGAVLEDEYERARRCTEEALRAVGDPARALILMKHVEGRNYDEIAASLGLSKGSVGTMLLRARRRVRELAHRCLGVGESEATAS